LIRLRTLAKSHPILFSIAAIAIAAVFTEISFKEKLSPAWGEKYASYIPGMLEQYIAALGAALLCAAIGLPGFSAYKPPRGAKAWLLGWPLALLSVLNADALFSGEAVISLSSPMLYVILLLYLSTGFFEEGLFRGLVMGLLLRRWGNRRGGAMAAVLVSSLLFSLTHIVNLIQGRYNGLASLAQIIFAIFFGVFFGALAIRTGSLMPGVLLHALFDFAGNLTALAPDAPLLESRMVSKDWAGVLVSLAVTAPLLAYGLFLMRKVPASASPSIGKSKDSRTSTEPSSAFPPA